MWRGPNGPRRSAARQALVNTANETKATLPSVLKDLPNIKADESEMLSLDTLPPLQKGDCPAHSKTIVKVIDEDTLNAAIMLIDTIKSSKAPASNDTSQTNSRSPSLRPAVLNFASDTQPGGGWQTGAMAQEEALCYRSSLSLSLHKRYYPWSSVQGLYTRDVVVIRSSKVDGHALLGPAVAVTDLPVVSVLSVAAVRNPKLSHEQVPGAEPRVLFAEASDLDLTKKKMRLALRMAAAKGHDCLVLGALGCGAFKNPVEQVALAWREVLGDTEFEGGWWREVWFAVLEGADGRTVSIFKEVLDGKEI